MKLAILRSDAPREKFPVYISNAGRSHNDAYEVAEYLSNKWDISVSYEPDADGCKQGRFFVDGTELTDLEIEGLNVMISQGLRRYPEVYDTANP